MSPVAANDALHNLRPTSLDGFLGQETVKERLRPWIAESRETGAPMAHVLLTSEPGMGKTTLAEVIAYELGDPFQTVDLSRMSEKQFISFVRRFEGGVLLLDEIHRAKGDQQEQLLTLMEPEAYVSTSYGGKIYVGWLTVIAATTQPQKLDAAVKSRFNLPLHILPYDDDTMTAIVASMARMIEAPIPEDDRRVLAVATAGNPRIARNLVRTWKAQTFTGTPSADSVLEANGRERDGLTVAHLEYLRKLDQLDGSAGERTLANHLRLHPSELAVLERLLVDRGLVALPSTGRAITGAGDARLRGESRTTPRRRETNGIPHRTGRMG